MSQAQRILDHLAGGGTLTRLDAWDQLGILEAPARISELRADGWPIQTTMVSVTNRYGERVSIARWHYDRSTPASELLYLRHKRQQVDDALRAAPNRLEQDRLRAELRIVNASIDQLIAIQGIPARTEDAA
jgi:hypothetical protein